MERTGGAHAAQNPLFSHLAISSLFSLQQILLWAVSSLSVGLYQVMKSMRKFMKLYYWGLYAKKKIRGALT
jgi:hypothetical protein